MGDRVRFVAGGGRWLRESLRVPHADERRARLARLSGREGDVLMVRGWRVPRLLAAPILRIRDRIDDDRRCYHRRPITHERRRG